MVRELVLQGRGLVAALVLGRLEHVPLVLLGVEMLEAEPEGDATDEGDAGDDAVVDDEEGVLAEGDKGLADGSGDGAHEQVHRHDEGLHVLGGLGVGVLVGCDVGEDFRDTDEDVGETLGPDVDGGRGTVLAAGVVAALAHCVDVVLHDGRGNHGEGRDEETDSHTLDGSKRNAELSEAGVEDVIDDGDHEDDGDGVEVLDNIVGNTVELEGGGLGGQVSGHLVVGEEEDGEEEEDLAGHETTADFVDPGVIVGHPLGAVGDGDVGGLCELPVELEATALLADEPEHLEELAEDGASGGRQLVVLLVDEENNGGREEEDGGDEEGQPEADVLLNVDHGDLTGEGAEVDTEVKVQEDTGVGHGRVDNDAHAIPDLDAHAGVLVLFSEQGRDVGLEETGADAEGDEADDEGAKGGVGLDDDSGSGGGDEDNVGTGGDTDGEMESPETTDAGISNPSTGVELVKIYEQFGPWIVDLPDKRHEIGKELVEERDGLSSLGTLSKSTSLSIGIEGSTRVGTLRELLANIVGIQDRRTIVGETFAKLNKGNGVHGPLDLSRDTGQGAQLLVGRQRIVRLLGADALDDGGLADVDGAAGGRVGVDAVVLWVGETRARNGVVVEVDGGRHFVCCLLGDRMGDELTQTEVVRT